VSEVSLSHENAKPEREVPKSTPTTTTTGCLESSSISIESIIQFFEEIKKLI
jgi:hypothetical protein